MAEFEQTVQEIANTVDPLGNTVVITDSVNSSLRATVDASGALKVTGSGGGEQHLDGDLSAGAKGTVALGSDGTTLKFLKIDANGELQVDVLSLPAITLASQINPFTTALPISGSVSVSNFPAIQPVSQSGVWSVGRTWTLASGTDSVDAVQSGLWTVQQGTPPWAVDVTDRDARVLGRTRLWDGTNVVDVISNRLKVEALIATGGADQDVHPVDANSVNMDVAPDVAMPVGTRALVIAGKDLSGITRFPTVTVDADDGKRRLEISGKIQVTPPAPPPATTTVQINADTPLSITGTNTTIFVIPLGVIFHLQQVVAGSQGDPTESGSRIDILYRDAVSVDHIVERVYVQGFSAFGIYPDTTKSRDGTTMIGNGVTTQIRVSRVRLSGSSQEVDAVVRGYTV